MSASDESNETKSENKTKEDNVDPAKVHSANSWESVDLGDEERKKKFLRLMGASKKEHHGKFVIGDHEPVHSRDKTDTEHVNEELERQFRYSQEHKITRFSHTGLGFDDNTNKSTDSKSDGESRDSNSESKDSKEKCKKPKENQEKDSKESLEESKEQSSEKKRESSDKVEAEASLPKKAKMMMNFVKASD